MNQAGARELPEKLTRLEVSINGAVKAELLRDGPYSLVYGPSIQPQEAASLILPVDQPLYQSGDLFPSMDMNLPEGYLFQRILELHRKFGLQKMHLLALAGDSGIGRVGYQLPGEAPRRTVTPVSREDILSTSDSEQMFEDLLQAYLQNGTGISGVQPKVMVHSRATLPVPDLIIKVAGPDFPGLSANEFLCLNAARHAGIATPAFDLSQDGKILVVDRFDISENGERMGFEDIAALMGLVVHDALSNRKYEGSYQAVSEVIAEFSNNPTGDLREFFSQLAFSVMIRNGDAHLKNFGLRYQSGDDVALAPMFDVVTTAIYTFERPGGIQDVDRTMALKLRRGRASRSRAYPTTDELLTFGRDVCRVTRPQDVLTRIAEGMTRALADARIDQRIPPALANQMQPIWEDGLRYASEAARN